MSNIILLNDYYRYELPPEPQKERDILFAGLPKKEQYWRRTPLPPNWKDLSERTKGKFIEQEVERMFVSGVWFANNGRLEYLPPDAYFYFNWWKMKDGEYPAFRQAQYKEILFENFAESIRNCIGTYRYKKRRDGLTTRRMCRTVWKAVQPQYANSWLGMQSKTGPDARDVCWETLMAGWRGLPYWIKPDQSGSSDPKKKLELRKPATRLSRTNVRAVMEDEDLGLNTTIDYRDTTENAYDGQELLDVSLDEAAKWIKARVLRAFTTYTKCVWKDGKKVGHIHAFSSPAQTNDRGHRESITLWNMGDPARSIRYDENGKLEVLKKSWFLLRYFTSALEGYGEACDKYGDCDQDLAAEMIREEIANAEPEMRGETERQLPISIDDILLNTEDMIFGNADQMEQRRKYLETITVKNEETKEAKYFYGNLEWKDGLQDSAVLFRPSKFQDDYTLTGKFCFQHLPPEDLRNGLVRKRKLGADVWACPPDASSVIGIDPYDYRRTESKNASKGAAVGGCALDFFDKGIKNKIWFSYLFRPQQPEDFYEDMLKASMFCTAFLQVESKNKNIIDYGEDRGFFDVFLSKDMKNPKSEHKGNAATASLTDEMCSLLDSYYGTEGVLEDFWMEHQIADNLRFNPANTLTSHMTMAQGQMLLGFQKLRLFTRKKHKPKNKTLQQEIAGAVAGLYGL